MSLMNIVYQNDDVFNLWEPVRRDNSVVYYEYMPIPESSNAVSTTNGFLQPNTRCRFINSSTSEKVLYSRSFIDIMAQIYDSQNPPQPITNPIDVALSNNFPMFDQAIFKLGGTSVETTTTLLSEKNLVKNLLDYSDDDRFSYQAQLWAPDSGIARNYGTGPTIGGPGLAVIKPTLPLLQAFNATTGSSYQTIPDAAYNQGAATRYRYTWGGWSTAPATTLPTGANVNGTGFVNIRVPVYRYFDFLAKDRFYTGNQATMELVVGPNQTNLFQVLVNSAVASAAGPPVANTITYAPSTITNGPVQLKVLSLTWMIPTIRAAPSLDNELLLKMNTDRTSTFSYRYCEPWVTSVNSGSNLNWLITSSSEKIDFVLIGFRWSNLINDPDQVQNSQVFHNVLQYMITTYLQIGSTNYPKDKYQPQMNQGSYGPMIPYNKLLEITNRLLDYEGGMSLTWNRFYNEGIYTLLPFDCRFTDENAAFQVGQAKEVRYFATFSQAAPALPTNLGTLNAYAFLFSSKEVSMNLINGAMTVLG